MASLFKRGKFFWVCYMENGKRVRYVLRTKEGGKVTDEKAAKYLVNNIENEIISGKTPLVINNLGTFEALEVYIEDSKHKKAAITQSKDRSCIKNFIDTGIKNLPQITESLVLSYLNRKLEAKIINKITANNNIKVLKAWLNWCVSKKYLNSNPLASTKYYPVDILPPKFLSKEDIKAILLAFEGETLRPAMVTSIYTGMRLGELQRLAWQDIDIKNATITIQKGKGGRFRVIPIHPDLKDIVTPANIPFNFKNWQKNIRRIKKISGVKFGWHSFRHTFASHLAQSGKVNIYKISKYLGHADVKTTQIYAHLIPDSQDIQVLDFVEKSG